MKAGLCLQHLGELRARLVKLLTFFAVSYSFEGITEYPELKMAHFLPF